MADKLLIHYRPSDSDQVSWCRIRDTGQITGSIHHGSISDLSNDAKGLRASLLIDASCTAMESVHIPSNNRQRQMQAAPFALEDSLATDIDYLYFALGKKQSDDNIPVITIDRSLFEQTLATFKQAGIFIEIMASDSLALPATAGSWSVLIYADNVLIKTGASQGYFCDRDLITDFLLALIDEQQTPPTHIDLYHAEDDNTSNQLLENLEIDVSAHTFPHHPLEIFASHLNDTKALNLLQGKFSPRRESSALWQPWKAVAAVALVWLLIELLYSGFEIRQLQYKNQQLTADIERAFKQANPGTRKFNNMKNRMESRLRQVRGGGGEEGEVFIDLLANAATSLNNKKITIRGMAYSGKHVDMELQASSLQDLEQLRSQLGNTNQIKVTLSTSVEKNKVKGRLRLEKQG